MGAKDPGEAGTSRGVTNLRMSEIDMSETTCNETGCEKPQLARGLCVTHYHRWNRATKADRPSVGTCEGCGATLRALKLYCGPDCRPRCSIAGCGKPMHAKGMCSAHATRAARYGDPVAPKVRHPNEGPCSVEGCDQPMRKTRLCAGHYSMLYHFGEIRDWNYRWGEGGYVPTHAMLRRRRGRPETLDCVDCGTAAEEWSYNGGDPGELIDPERGAAFTRNLAAYSPRCIRCHRIYDENPIAMR